MKNKYALTVLELISAVCIISILLGIFGVYVNIAIKTSRETALKNELLSIRMSLDNYRMLKGKNPEDLKILFSQEFAIQKSDGLAVKQKYLQPFRLDSQGFLLDPFGKRYYYNAISGSINSQSKGYGNW